MKYAPCKTWESASTGTFTVQALNHRQLKRFYSPVFFFQVSRVTHRKAIDQKSLKVSDFKAFSPMSPDSAD